MICLKCSNKSVVLSGLVLWGHYTRPVLMTAFAVSVGMLPLAQGSAIGLERLIPLYMDGHIKMMKKRIQ